MALEEGLDGPLWSGERSRGSREGLHDPPIGGWRWVRQRSRQKLVFNGHEL